MEVGGSELLVWALRIGDDPEIVAAPLLTLLRPYYGNDFEQGYGYDIGFVL